MPDGGARWACRAVRGLRRGSRLVQQLSQRHCPNCQGLARAQWLVDRRAELLPVPYFHVVFTVPAPIAAIALQNKALVYDILFKAASETIRVIGADPRHLGAETGMIAILHTWGQTLTHHPHVLCIVPGGGLGPDGGWVACRPGFFLPVHVLSRFYRRLFLERLTAASDAGDLTFFGDLSALREPAAFARYLAPSYDIEWVVYAKRPFGGARQVLEYLGRYTHRVAIANGRLLACDDGAVRFRWKDYRASNKSKAMTLDAGEFMRRFLMHVLPKGFRRIRHFGFLANARRAQKLAKIRAALDIAEPPLGAEPADYRERYATLTGKRIDICPCCGGRMVDLGPLPRPSKPRHSTQRCDTS
ncbi:IS91 family transposase [Methylosinus sp. sav-2]|uniref:IS91 family transposase n=1 Tax=Methylosinus sp. sav-2 TaxID=2485168 RepID=UPI001FDF90BF|nr:IS91 family transposase [Methylosinus sp. sav-2]